MASNSYADPIQVGIEKYNSEGFLSENILTENGLLKSDDMNDMTQVLTYLNTHIMMYSPFMWLNGGQGGYDSTELEGDGQYYWQVMGEVKEHDTIVGSPYSTGDKPGYQISRFVVYLSSGWMKEGWLIKFRDGYMARIFSATENVSKGYWEYVLEPYNTVDPDDYCNLDNLEYGEMVQESIYPVAKMLDVGTETNSQIPAKRTNQISKVRFSHRITGNISNKQVQWFTFPESRGGDGKTKNWVDYDWWVNQYKNEKKLERFLFEESIYNRDSNGRIYLKDHRAGNNPIMTGASVKQQIMAEGNYASYADSFTTDFWERTVGDMTYGKPDTIDFIGWAGTEYMNDFGDAIAREAANKGYVEAIGDQRVSKTSDGLNYSNMKFKQYTTKKGDRITYIYLPFLDDPGVSNQVRHPRTGKPVSSHSCYYVAQGMTEDGKPAVKMIAEKGEAKVQGIYRGLTNIPKAWGDISSRGDMSMIDLATERNEASIHERRSVGVQLRDARYTFYHYSDIN